MTLYIRVLSGGVEVQTDNRERVPLQPLAAAALGLLVAVGGRSGISRQHMKDMLWGLDDDFDRNASLKVTMSKLRKVLGGDRVIYAHDRYRFIGHERDYVDLRVSRLLTARADHLRFDDPARAAGLYEQALDLWVDSPMTGLPYSPAAAGYLNALRNEQQVIVESMVETMLSAGRHREAAAKTPVLVAADPLNEHLRSLRMVALARSGQKALALLEYESAEAAVMAGAGAKPGLALRTLRRKIINDDPSLEWTRSM
ncbi:AfsR/SARP family transcriptional regulator [Spirillospora sp. CA-128828]|uniref:AfsR/SARP family transcriptional regulator n=1 Tax=Spirillospora sp. CA-128828 TaxID=3240033 RepID=UPI003D91A92F